MHCQLCNQNLKDVREANDHIPKCLYKIQRRKNAKNLIYALKHKCLQCNITFSNNLQLHQHLGKLYCA